MPDEIKESTLKKLFNECEIANYNKEELMEYEQSWKEYNDLQNIIHTAEVKAEQKGVEKGVEKGAYDKAKEVALNALKKGLDNQLIHELTGLSLNEIEKLQREAK